MFGTVAPDGSQVYGLPTMQNAAVHIRTIPSTRPVVALSDQMLLSRQLRDFIADEPLLRLLDDGFVRALPKRATSTRLHP